MLVNNFIPDLFTDALIVGENGKGKAVVCKPVQWGSAYLDYRFPMTIADQWVKILRKREEDWKLGDSIHTLTNRNGMEKYVGNVDSQDQVIAGKEVVIFQGTLARQLGKNDPQNCAFEGSLFTHPYVKFGIAVKDCSLMLSASWDSSNSGLRWVDEFNLNSIVEGKVNKIKEFDEIFTFKNLETLLLKLTLVCQTTPFISDTKYLFLELPLLKNKLESFAKSMQVDGGWNQQTTITTQAWLSGELKSRDEWEKGWKNTKNVDFYQYMGKNKVPFHTVIVPATLLGTEENWTVMKTIYTEYLNYEAGNCSKRKGVGVIGNEEKLNSESRRNPRNFINRALSFMAKDSAIGYGFLTLDTEGKWKVRAMMPSQQCGTKKLYEVPRSLGIQFQEWQPVFSASIGELTNEKGSLGVAALGVD
ncbi:unnamed protein product [Cuscuta europaea]|uniref:Methionyl/Leucyl tRNA synthetase domain-containing protein n=1 Tax=Cuscuta europaea TaxID=41803 RepID=A0A9P1EF23_CUSEU|nr:unnamed protein product [Cuscuta europaea]